MNRNPLLAHALALAGALFAGALFTAPGLHAAPVKTSHVEAELVAETRTAAPGQTLTVALHQKIVPGWHTYWRNPGDAGEATTLDWTLPQGWSAGPIIWPQPERFSSAGLMNYVFSGEVYLPATLQVPADARPGRTTLSAVANWLVCKDVCVPETTKLSLPVTIGAAGAQPQPDPVNGPAVAAAVADAPKPAGLKAVFAYQAKTEQVRLSVSGTALQGVDLSKAYFFPYDGTVLDHVKPQAPAKTATGMTLLLPAGYAFTHNKPPAKLEGVLTFGPARGFEVSAAPARRGELVGGPGAGGGDNGLGGLPGALAFAFLGGLVLNLMPCVFPVLSIKAAALARHVEAPAKAAAEGLVFLVGCVLTFVALAAALIAAQQAGQAVGWGFQLQSPGVVASLTLLMLLVALNLSGVFEIGLSVQGTGQGLAAKGGLVGAFFTGVLAVVVAAPCTAPFMAGAIGWAFTQPPAAALSVFVALGLGLAAPFMLISLIPGLFKRLPRPGAWMEGLKKTLAFPMYGSAAWLAWVFVQQAGDNGLALLFAAAIFAALAAWLFGVSQRASRPALSRIGALAGLAAAIPLAVMGSAMTASAGTAAGGGASPIAGIAAEPWSPAKVDSLRAAGRPVFVDFTAAWCVTCQVNERTALATRGVADAFRRDNAAYLKADWTNHNAEIAGALKALGRAGVPLYLVYDVKGGEPQVLPQILSEGGVATALDAAAHKPNA